MRGQEKDIVSATKVIIETHIAVKLCCNYSKIIIEKTTRIVHYTTEKVSNITMTNINWHKAGFH